ncbi:MAG: hypothetical protein EOL91_09765 [Actinobacteria bacterium]|nr:hypothetical protein [Actinomycetota bacterium]
MTIVKRILCPERIRRIPRSFSWIDHRLVREDHLSNLSHEAQALYLFLVTVSDAEGLSYYSDGKVTRILNMAEPQLWHARNQLRSARLIAYCRPLYQVLSLDRQAAQLSTEAPRCNQGGVPISEILGRIMSAGDKGSEGGVQ